MADTLRDRIRRGEIKAGEPMPTQGRLAEEFCVERGTIRQALRILHTEGLLTEATRGAPAKVAATSPVTATGDPVGTTPQPTVSALGPRLARAFEAEEVRIDALSLTSESLMLAMTEPLRLIHENRLKPVNITLRVLLPARNIELAFPKGLEPSEASLVHQRWLQQRNSQGHVLRNTLRSLYRSHGIDVTVTFRALPFTPPLKLYVLNGSEALFAYYQVTKRPEVIEDVNLEMYDTLGPESVLFAFDAEKGPRDAAFVEQSAKWFDALWNTITSDLTLS
ncbi:GntR family transcriptional regulator [Streptomyces spiroverticillatus]|uniref:GntR family transcriptional regulator n=1 Tax=Streptomyces finlayi TaxID=67296 RepID=A0A918WTU2_9ACTN|nr:GntR family transcriptional regulator [Streptomyces spiroverticillatus]GHC82335.1 GntR family transcriptional regulator [Streptomyces finlayi]